MKQPFSVQKIFREWSFAQIKHFYQTFQIHMDLDWGRLKAADRKKIVAFHEQLPVSVRRQVEGEIYRIALLSCQRGIETVHRVAPAHHNILWDVGFRPTASYYQKAVWLWLSDRVMFDDALDTLRNHLTESSVGKKEPVCATGQEVER